MKFFASLFLATILVIFLNKTGNQVNDSSGVIIFKMCFGVLLILLIALMFQRSTRYNVSIFNVVLYKFKLIFSFLILLLVLVFLAMFDNVYFTTNMLVKFPNFSTDILLTLLYCWAFILILMMICLLFYEVYISNDISAYESKLEKRFKNDVIFLIKNCDTNSKEENYYDFLNNWDTNSLLGAIKYGEQNSKHDILFAKILINLLSKTEYCGLDISDEYIASVIVNNTIINNKVLLAKIPSPVILHALLMEAKDE